MITAIPLATHTVHEAKRTASQMGLSPARLYAMAITEFVQSHSTNDVSHKGVPDDITQAQYDMLGEEDW